MPENSGDVKSLGMLPISRRFLETQILKIHFYTFVLTAMQLTQTQKQTINNDLDQLLNLIDDLFTQFSRQFL